MRSVPVAGCSELIDSALGRTLRPADRYWPKTADIASPQESSIQAPKPKASERVSSASGHSISSRRVSKLGSEQARGFALGSGYSAHPAPKLLRFPPRVLTSATEQPHGPAMSKRATTSR